MDSIILYSKSDDGLSISEINSALDELISKIGDSKKTLLIPPDYTRLHSGAGLIASLCYKKLSGTVNVMPALGTHTPMTEEEISKFLDGIPIENVLEHKWREDIVQIGTVPGDYVNEVSGGIMDDDIPVEVNKELLNGYDHILSIGQVVPHEVVGMANYTKNIVIGVGGPKFISKSHMLGALYGLERMMGKDLTPVRKVFDFAEENFLSKLPIIYLLTVTTNSDSGVKIHGLFIGTKREIFEKAVLLAQEKNMTFVDKPFKKAVAFLDPEEFKSTWVGNKAIYRTRMAMADGGELYILAKGVNKFGEDKENDRVIRLYGYIGRENIIKLFKTEFELQNNQSVAAHLVHGSSDGRFRIIYCTKALTKEEVEGVGFDYMPYDEAFEMFKGLKNGLNKVGDEEIFYIDNPALGLWAFKC
ncbi:MAG: lactate racemase domain-containing protein [Oscillospiraceae bacterium]|nr:lactate racemase domain-containing protein [Oscillospiraceae bacterium]